MSNSIAESLAKKVLDGTYTLSEFVDCQPKLPVDRNPHVVRYTQFLLFGNPARNLHSRKEPEYAILQQFRLFGRDRDPDTKAIENELIKPIARELSDELVRAPLPGAGGALEPKHLPNPNDARIDVDRLRVIALESQIPSYQPNVTDAEARSLYKNWHGELIRERLLETVEPLERAGFDFEEEFALDISHAKLTPVLENILKIFLLPSPYQPFKNPHPHFALCATFEQTWEPKGYTRGELINTISLAPGEQLTLEIHSWDKSTIKSEEELATESEMRVSQTLTERDVRTVVREVGTHVKVTADIPTKVGTITPDVGVNTNLRQTLDQTRERTTEASNSLKTSRKLRIEVSREVGREQKQTRVIANTNRCHTLNCHYFEVMTNYLVSTQLASVRLCLLLPSARVKVTAAWVLCHEDILIQALLSKAFLPGFKAAKALETHAAFLQLKKEEVKNKGEVTDPGDELKNHVGAILGAYNDLKGALKKVKKSAKSKEAKAAAFFGGTLAWAGYVAAKCGVTVLRRVLYLAVLHANEPALNALKKLSDEASAKASEALRNFFAAVTPTDFKYNVASATVAKALDAVGIPEKLVDALLKWGYLSYVDFAADDAGLYNDVQAAAARLDELWGLPPVGSEPAVPQEGFSSMEIAEARVTFEQLRCHIDDNWFHYLQSLWLREHPDERFTRMQGYGSIAAVLDNDLLGFLGHKAAYPINDLEAVKRWIDFNEIKKTISIPPSEPQLITLPTQGTILEAVVGECDACEDFIQQSRVLDLRTQEAKTRQEEEEARRRKMRLETDPPDLSDPPALTAGRITINLEGGQPPQPE